MSLHVSLKPPVESAHTVQLEEGTISHHVIAVSYGFGDVSKIETDL